MDLELAFGEILRKFDELDARSERRWAALEQRGAAIEPHVGDVEQSGATRLVVADNWGGLFDEIPSLSHEPVPTSDAAASYSNALPFVPTLDAAFVPAPQVQELEEKLHVADIVARKEALSEREVGTRLFTRPPYLHVSLFAPAPDAIFDSELSGTGSGRASFPGRIRNPCADDDSADDPEDPGPKFASQTSFRIRGGAEIADLFRKLGLSDAEDIAIFLGFQLPNSCVALTCFLRAGELLRLELGLPSAASLPKLRWATCSTACPRPDPLEATVHRAVHVSDDMPLFIPEALAEQDTKEHFTKAHELVLASRPPCPDDFVKDVDSCMYTHTNCSSQVLNGNICRSNCILHHTGVWFASQHILMQINSGSIASIVGAPASSLAAAGAQLVFNGMLNRYIINLNLASSVHAVLACSASESHSVQKMFARLLVENQEQIASIRVSTELRPLPWPSFSGYAAPVLLQISQSAVIPSVLFWWIQIAVMLPVVGQKFYTVILHALEGGLTYGLDLYDTGYSSGNSNKQWQLIFIQLMISHKNGWLACVLQLFGKAKDHFLERGGCFSVYLGQWRITVLFGILMGGCRGYNCFLLPVTGNRYQLGSSCTDPILSVLVSDALSYVSDALMTTMWLTRHAGDAALLQGFLVIHVLISSRAASCGTIVACRFKMGAIVLLFDGLHVQICTFSFGSDGRSAAMHAISYFFRGTFPFIDAAGSIQDGFAQCIGGLLGVAVKEMQLGFEYVDNGVLQASTNSGGYTSQVAGNGRGGSVDIGDLYTDEDKGFLVTLGLGLVAEHDRPPWPPPNQLEMSDPLVPVQLKILMGKFSYICLVLIVAKLMAVQLHWYKENQPGQPP